MEAVKRYLFWIVLGVALLLAAGGYLLIVPGIQGETHALQGSNDSKRTEIANLAKNPKDIKNQAYVQAADNYAKYLTSEKTQLTDLLKDRKIVLEGRFKEVPEDLQIQFDQWLKDTRQAILDLAAKGGLRLPADLGVQRMFEGKKTEDAADRERRIKQLALIHELVRILAETKSEVIRVGFEPDMKKQDEVSQRLPAGASSLDGLDVLNEKEFAAKANSAARKAWELVRAGSTFKEDNAPKPYKSTGVELRFTAPFSSIPKLLQALENSNVYYGIVHKVDTQRTSAAYPEDPAKGLPPRKDEAVPANNTFFQEAPLQVLVLLELIAYDPVGAATAAAPPPAPAPAKKK